MTELREHMPLVGAKPWYASKGVIGPIVAAACAVMAAAGITLKAPPQDVTDAIVTLAPLVMAAIASIVGLIGRITATRRIGPAVLPPPTVRRGLA